jgi:hypothetical protein
MRGPEEKEELGTLADLKRTVNAFKRKVVEDMATIRRLEEAEDSDIRREREESEDGDLRVLAEIQHTLSYY